MVENNPLKEAIFDLFGLMFFLERNLAGGILGVGSRLTVHWFEAY